MWDIRTYIPCVLTTRHSKPGHVYYKIDFLPPLLFLPLFLHPCLYPSSSSSLPPFFLPSRIPTQWTAVVCLLVTRATASQSVAGAVDQTKQAWGYAWREDFWPLTNPYLAPIRSGTLNSAQVHVCTYSRCKKNFQNYSPFTVHRSCRIRMANDVNYVNDERCENGERCE